MKPETNCCNIQCHPILNYTESFKALADREFGLKSIAKFVPNIQESKLIKRIKI